jgi:hypothetical protein
MPTMSIHVARLRRQVVGDEVDAHVGVLQEGVAGAEHEHGGEQVPLDFQEGVGAHVEGLAHDGVAGRDQHGGQDQPHQAAAESVVHPVDPAGKLQHGVHRRDSEVVLCKVRQRCKRMPEY